MENDIPNEWNLKQSWVSVHMSDKVDFNLKLVNKDEDYSYILTKETIH
jgi:hypothetical protein